MQELQRHDKHATKWQQCRNIKKQQQFKETKDVHRTLKKRDEIKKWEDMTEMQRHREKCKDMELKKRNDRHANNQRNAKKCTKAKQ